MKVTLVPGRELTPAHIDSWTTIQRQNDQLRSPFFCPEFAVAVAAARSDVEVAILEHDGEPCGYFPFQRNRWNIGKPVGAGLNDFQGVISRSQNACDSESGFDLKELLHECRLLAWMFDRLVASQPMFAPHQWEIMPSPYMNVADGFEAYLAGRNSHAKRIHNTLRKMRAVESVHGKIRLVAQETDPAVFDALRQWKSEQYRRNGVLDVFSLPWTVHLLQNLQQQRDAAFGGMLSALYFGDQLAAVHFGLRSNGVLHAWFPAYDQRLARYSPGMMLFLKLAEAAASLGIRRIDLGAGHVPFKLSLQSGFDEVASGAVAFNPVVEHVQKNWWRVKDWVRSSPLRIAARTAANWTRPLRGWMTMH